MNRNPPQLFSRTLALSSAWAFLFSTSLIAQVGGGYESLHQWDGYANHDTLGNAVSIAGDVNGDGYDDVIVGAPWADFGGTMAVGSAYVFSGADGTLLHQWNGVGTRDFFGWSVSGAGDVNRDGYSDLIIGAPGTPSGNVFNVGSAFVFSGADGTLIHRWDGANSHESLGLAVSDVGDLNGDGHDDLAVSATGTSSGGRIYVGSAYVYSGIDGSLVHHWQGDAENDLYGDSLAGAGDVDGDGVNDIIVGASRADPGGIFDAGSAYVYSGATGTLIYKWSGVAPDDSFGYSVSSAGDASGDGYCDLIVGAPLATPGGIATTGAAYLYSGANGAMIRQWSGTASTERYGSSVAGVGDIDGDGIADVIVGSPDAITHNLSVTGSVFAYSGVDGSMLHRWEGGAPDAKFGTSVAGYGDLNSDGYNDIIVGARFADPNGLRGAGSAFAFSFNPFITASDFEISIAAGGTIQLELDFPTQAANFQYKVLASRSGVGPTKNGVEIPLTLDSVMHRSWLGRYPGATEGHLQGWLDAEGRATATIHISAGNWTELIGIKFHIAAVAKPFWNLPEYSSVAVTLTITP